jgi:hypothetical protein
VYSTVIRNVSYSELFATFRLGCLDQTLSGEFGSSLYPCTTCPVQKLPTYLLVGAGLEYEYRYVVWFLLSDAFKLHTPVNHPEESVQHSERGESLKSGINLDIFTNFIFVCFVFQVNAK